MKAKNASLRTLIEDVERHLSQYYSFPQHSQATDHLIARNDVKLFLGDQALEQKEWDSRAAVWVAGTPGNIFIGIHIQDEILQPLMDHDPLDALCNENLDAFTTLVEEISHFHLILNRAVDGRPVTRTELEWQGEIDKLLVSALYLQKQRGDPHLVPLARILFDKALIISDDHETYWQATKRAARFWYHIAETENGLNSAVRETLRLRYHSLWEAKHRIFPQILGAA